jgi:hypothetical protein
MTVTPDSAPPRSDECLWEAGGAIAGSLDFSSWHSYTDSDGFKDYSQFRHSQADFPGGHPIVIGEFSHANSGCVDRAAQVRHY